MKYIVIDYKTKKSLYGLNGITLKFSTEESAKEFAEQLCTEFLVVGVNW